MMPLIMAVPMPAMFILDRVGLPAPRGIIQPNIRSMRVLRTGTACGRRSRFRPQKVKNIVTSLPMAAAPLAMMNAAIALSKSSLKTTRVLCGW